jgi:CoA:oxalate CoA-transferase
MARVLDGVRVVDFTTTIAGPYCTRLLADMGAEVIKVENAEGDMMRTRPPLREGASASFGQLNAGKKSVVLDLKSEAGQAAATRLIETADVLVENFRPGVMSRFGLDFATLSKQFPKLVYCSISGYGQTGPSAKVPAYAPVVHAAAGFDLAHLSYQSGRDRPDYCGVFIADVLAGTYAFGAVMSAINYQQRTGEGQHVDVSMMESMLSLTLTELQGSQFEMAPPGKPMFGPVETSDGYIMLAIASERTFRAAAVAASRLDWLEDPRFKVYIDRRANWAEFMDEFEAWSKTLDSATCLIELDSAGVPAAAYRTVREALADPQIAHRAALTEITDAGGVFKALNMPFQMSAVENTPNPFVAALGEHTVSVLESVGLDRSAIDKMSD